MYLCISGSWPGRGLASAGRHPQLSGTEVNSGPWPPTQHCPRRGHLTSFSGHTWLLCRGLPCFGALSHLGVLLCPAPKAPPPHQGVSTWIRPGRSCAQHPRMEVGLAQPHSPLPGRPSVDQGLGQREAGRTGPESLRGPSPSSLECVCVHVSPRGESRAVHSLAGPGAGPCAQQPPSPPPPLPAGAGTGDILVTRLAFHPGAVCKVSPGGAAHPQHSRPHSSGAQKQPGFLAGWGAGQRCSGTRSRWGCGTAGTEVKPRHQGPESEALEPVPQAPPDQRPRPSKGPGTQGHGGWHHPVAHVCVLSRVQCCATLQTVALQAPLTMGFSRQEYWSGLPFPPPGDLPEPGIELRSSASPALPGGFLTTEPPGKPQWTATFGKVSDD